MLLNWRMKLNVERSPILNFNPYPQELSLVICCIRLCTDLTLGCGVELTVAAF